MKSQAQQASGASGKRWYLLYEARLWTRNTNSAQATSCHALPILVSNWPRRAQKAQAHEDERRRKRERTPEYDQ